MKINTGCILLFFLLLQLQLFGQGPITGFMPGGKGTDLALTYSQEGYDEYFFGRERQAIDYEVHSLSLFIEHGITDSLSIVVNLPYLRADELNKGLQDGAVWAKYRNGHDQFASGRLTQITAVGLSFPLSRYPVMTDNPIGLRSTVLQGRYAGQFQFNNGLFINLQAGLDFQISPNNQTALPVLARMGWGSAKFYLEAWLEYYHTFESGVDLQIQGGQGSRWWRTGGVLYYAFSDDFGIFLGGAYILSGRNIGQSVRINTGVVYKWKRGQ
jgi:hypothetical protein